MSNYSGRGRPGGPGRAARSILSAVAVLVLALAVLSQTVSAQSPEIRIISPAHGSTITGSAATVELAVSNFTLNGSAIGGPAKEGEGHYHLYIDDVYTGGPSVELTRELAGLTPGVHTIKVDLRNNDHTPLSPPSEDSITVEVVAGPSIRIVSPENGATLERGDVVLTMQVSNFVLDQDAIGGVNVDGEGHYHVFVDDVYTGGPGTALTRTISGLDPGAHTIRVTLNNNDHTPLSPPVEDGVTFEVSSEMSADAANILIMVGLLSVIAGAGAAAYMLSQRRAAGSGSGGQGPERGAPGGPSSIGKGDMAMELGYNYLVYERKEDVTYVKFREMMEKGIPGICMTTSYPEKLKKENVFAEGTTFYWLSDADADVSTLNPKRLDFEVTKTVLEFLRGNEGGAVVLIDGMEHLVLENSFGKVIKFLTKVCDLASLTNGSIMVSINPEALSAADRTVLEQKFDRLLDLR